MKRILVLVVAAACGVLSASAEVKWSYEGTTLTEILPEGSTDTPWVFSLPSSGKTAGQLQIPTTVGTSTHLDFGEGTLPEGAPEITSFATKIFYNNKTIKTIVLPETLVSFGSQAFQSSGITSLTIPTSVTSIGTHFVYQTSVTNICFKEPAKVTNFNVTSIFNTSTIRWMNIPASVTSIGTALSALINKATVVVVFDGDLIETDTCMFRTDTGANYDDYLNVKFDYEGNPNWQAFVDNPEYVTKWADLDSATQAKFFAKFPGEPHPYGRVIQTAKGMRVNSWVSINYRDGEYPYDDGYLATMDDSVTTNWVDGNLVYTFKNVDTRGIGQFRQDMTLKKFLVVGGGGAGGGTLGGGGGGGAALLTERSYPLVAGTAFDIAVGKGVVGAKTGGASGAATTFAFGEESVVAYGGGGGGYVEPGQDATRYPTEGTTLASGGGAAMRTSVKATSGLDYTAEQGNCGGSAVNCSAGGGGGFESAGGTGVSGAKDGSTYTGGTSGAGGAGLETVIRGETEIFGAGGGGGGGSFYTSGGSKLYCRDITAGTADETAGSGGQSVAGTSASAGFGGGGGGGGASLSGTTNTGYLGGNGGSGCVILVFSLGIQSAQPAVDEIAVTFPDGYTQPSISVAMGGEGEYAATVTISCGTGALAQAGTAFECVRTFTGVANGDSVDVLADFYPNPGEQVYVKVEVSATGASDVTESADKPAEGQLPAFVGHGGDPEQVIHVRDGATGKATGRNWADAYPDFRVALKRLADEDDARGELWYCGSNTLTKASAETVKPLRAAVIRGGFTGVEDSTAARAANAKSTIDGEGLYSTFVLNNAAGFTVDGFRFINSSASGIKKTGAGDLVVSNCEFEANGLPSAFVAGRAVNATGDGEASCLTLSNCRIARHRTSDNNEAAPTLLIQSFARATVADCLIISNRCQEGIVQSNGHGAALRVVNTLLDLHGTRFIANQGMIGHNGGQGALSDSGGIVSIQGACGGSTIANCLWAANQIVDGSSNNTDPDKTAGSLVIALNDPSVAVTVRNCTFAGNFYCRDAATSGLSVKAGTVDVVDSIFYGNLASTKSKFPGHAAVRDLRVAAGATARVRYTLFADDTGCFTEEGGTLTRENCRADDPRFVTTTSVASCLNASGESFDAAKWNEFAKFNAHVRDRHGYTDEFTGELVKYAGNSPAVDAGDPAAKCIEPHPNGNRVNLGFYGNTPWAAMSGGGLLLQVR